MKLKYFFLIVVLFLFLISFISSTCTVTFDKTGNYSQGEQIISTMICSEVTEKNTPYNLIWTNASNFTIETDTGTTPNSVNQNFFESFIIPDDYVAQNGTNISAFLTGSDLEGSDKANISAAGTNNLIITPGGFSANRYIGLTAGVKFTVEDENSKKLTNAQCRVNIQDEDGKPIEISDLMIKSINGECQFRNLLEPQTFDEGISYLATINCYCGQNETESSCIDEDGTIVINSVGTVSGVLTIKSWLEVNTLTDRDVYNPKQEIFVCVNVTNIDYSSRIPMQIYHQIRCSSELDNNNDTDRVLIVSDGELPDERGISTNTTQMQCKRFVIPDAKYLQGKTSECYASTSVWVLDSERKKLIGYSTTSPVFNITLTNLQLYANWKRVSDYKWNTVIDLSKRAYQEYSGIGTGDVKIHLAHPFLFSIDSPDQYGGNEMPFDNLLSAEQIKNISATNSTGGNVTTSLHYKKQGQLDLYLESVDISSTGWYNVTIDLNSFEKRQTEALEGIESKTGTFHLSVDCPSTGIIGEDISCTITAYIEDSQIVEKEVDFTCHISDGSNTYSAVNFNKMITRNAISINQDFQIPVSFISEQQYVLQCHADYYNLGSRRDSFYDTFTAVTTPSSRLPEEESPGITGGIIRKSPPFIPEGKAWIILIIALIIATTLLILIRILKRKEICFPAHQNKKNPLKTILVSLLIISGFIAASIGIYYLCTVLSNSLQPIQQTVETQSTSVSIFQDKLTRGIILTAFIVLMIIILFKSLHIRGELKFGEDTYVKKYRPDKKLSRMQKKLNRFVLKDELKRKRTTQHPRIKKVRIKKKR